MLRFHSLQVAQIQPDADDAVAISLSGARELAEPYRGLAGQHIVLRTRIDGREVRRTYSLVSAPGEWPLRIVVRVHAQGTMSRYLAEQLRIGDAIDVLPPNGSLTPRSVSGGRRTFVAFAAGCGITPILSIVRAVLAGDAASRFVLFYGNTGANRAMCLEELLALKDRYPDRLALHFIMSREPQEAELYNGRIDAARVQRFAQAFFDPAGVAEYFVCGPGTMVDDITALLRTLGVQAERLHGEHFNLEGAPESPSQSVPVSAAPAAAADQAEVTVVMDGRRRSFTMRMNDESVLDAAARAGLELPFSCRAGVCSTCRTRVVTGQVVMQENHALEDWELEAGYVLACQARVTTPVLELDYDEK